jgi:ribonuclease HI
MAKYKLYTDGSCKNEIGGYAYIILKDEREVEVFSDRVENTTNNRMEMQAVIAGLKRFANSAEINIYTDSAYVMNCFLQKWYLKWRRNQWKNSQGDDVKNKTLWQELIPLVESREVTWIHVKGHSGNVYNERVDYLARSHVI